MKQSHMLIVFQLQHWHFVGLDGEEREGSQKKNGKRCGHKHEGALTLITEMCYQESRRAIENGALN